MNRIAGNGSHSRHNYRIFMVINSVGYIGILVHLALIPIFYALGFPELSFLNIASSILWISAWLMNHQDRYNTAILLMTVEVISHTLLVVPTVGWQAGFQYYLFAAVPFTLFNNRFEGKAIIFISVALCIEFLLLSIYTSNRPPSPLLSDNLVKLLDRTNIVIAFAAQGVISYYFRLASIYLEQELEKQAHTDPLTGLYNRRRMLDFLLQQGKLAEREQTALSVAFVDIDHFKKINDNYGHETGDQILSAVAEFVKRQLRKGDTLARWGGEEFLLLLPHTDLDGARVLAEKICATVAEHVFQIDGKDYSVTLTIGLCEHRTEHPIEKSIKLADIALYRGKQAGRNRVMCYS
ncbi:GGDEF domain-containing protein [Methylomicrobium sp. RS1]|jgi:diguanylate cyclase (GGDEF)-like protein|uniref:GGDEF domain-containing protein n=1 Tax=Candidatus Methylomicrobium oryzae TaxID=2802053 RepID=UPI0019240300|nr:GGDEF domain-containing protein [Methylomicrobium sp. RS1]MBL1262853.1 GGDEF domain-containing protein [Methylomicrobium sp. RS1]